MGLFSNNIVTSELQVPLKVRFGCDLSNMIRDNHKTLIFSLRTHGTAAVMNTIEQYVNTIRRSKKYFKHLIVCGRNEWSRWDHGYDYEYVTLIKGDLYIVLHTRNVDEFHWGNDVRDSPGTIIIILDRYLREKKFKVV